MKKSYQFTFFIISAFLFFYGIILARDFLYPLAFGILLSYLLYPIANFLEKKSFPRILAILLSIVIATIIVTGITIFIIKRISAFSNDLPYFRDKAIQNIRLLEETIKNSIGIPDYITDKFLNRQFFDLSTKSEEIFSATTGTIFMIGMQPVYIFLFLYYRTKFAYFILKAAGKEKRLITIRVLKEISTVVTRYMLGVSTVVIILCFFNSAGYLILGLKYPFLLGIVSAIFSFIPYFGNFIGGAFPFLFALLTQDSYIYSLRVVVFVFIVHFLENNVLSPNIVGTNIRLNPFFIILGLILGAMVWGIPGMLVIIPFLAMLKIVISNIPEFQHYSYLLGTTGTKKHALTLQNMKRFINRKKKGIDKADR
jgi:predicted PurR-regulated permease PerM